MTEVARADREHAGAGLDEAGRWTPAFDGQRAPFPAGNAAAVRHGSYMGPLRLSERSEEIVGELREAMPYKADSFAGIVQATAAAGARFEKAEWALNNATDPNAMEELKRDAARWWRLWVKGLEALGLTPPAASQLGLTLALTQRSARATLAEEYARDDGADR